MSAGPRPRQSSDDEPQVPQVTVEALQRALACEHAALWAYKMALAFIPPEWATRARGDIEAHTTLRGQITQTLSDIGQRPVSAQPAYAAPQPVVDGLKAMVECTGRLAYWRGVTERSPVVPVFPGRS